MATPVEINVHAPYEAAIVAVCGVIEKAMDGQTPEQRAALWKMTLENMSNWHNFWQGVGDIFKPKPKLNPNADK